MQWSCSIRVGGYSEFSLGQQPAALRAVAINQLRWGDPKGSHGKPKMWGRKVWEWGVLKKGLKIKLVKSCFYSGILWHRRSRSIPTPLSLQTFDSFKFSMLQSWDLGCHVLEQVWKLNAVFTAAWVLPPITCHKIGSVDQDDAAPPHQQRNNSCCKFLPKCLGFQRPKQWESTESTESTGPCPSGLLPSHHLAVQWPLEKPWRILVIFFGPMWVCLKMIEHGVYRFYRLMKDYDHNPLEFVGILCSDPCDAKRLVQTLTVYCSGSHLLCSVVSGRERAGVCITVRQWDWNYLKRSQANIGEWNWLRHS